MANLVTQFCDKLMAQYPRTQALSDLEERLMTVISPLKIEFPKSAYQRVVETVALLYSHANSTQYLEKLIHNSTAEEAEILKSDIPNKSILMAYDFHYNPADDKLKLIEINTNASAFLLSNALYDFHNSQDAVWNKPVEKLKNSILNELKLCNKTQTAPRIAIIDDNISQQKMYVEFLMYQSLFESWGWSCELVEASAFNHEGFDFVYNRTTDFTFQEHKHLHKMYLQKNVPFSPHPREYLKLAAKERLIDFSSELRSDALPTTLLLNATVDKESIWAQRKNLFFKPSRSYGGKAAYRGSSISRTVFEKIFSPEFLAQEYCPPAEKDGWKYDLRFYAYADQIHLGIARSYKGQVTNFATPGGGLSLITLV